MNAKFLIENLAEKAGFIACGMAPLRKLNEEEMHFKNWIENGFHGRMKYMENHFEKRMNPSLLLPGAKSIIVFLYNYFSEISAPESAPKIAKYAYGEDYHHVIKNKLHEIAGEIKKQFPEFEYRAFTDSAPVMERQWAQLAGLGWIGKNSLLLRKGVGSFFFIGSIICNLEAENAEVQTDHCGTCTACIDACPTHAIVQDGVIDGSKCISYLTIELKDELPASFEGKLEDWIFGCDICQDVCPWNRFAAEHSEPAFLPNPSIFQSREQWMAMNPEEFEKSFGRSPLLRAGLSKIQNSLQKG